MASLGTRPTVGGTVPLLEVHLFDFDGDLYGREIEVEFVAKLREEEHFASVDVMVEQVAKPRDRGGVGGLVVVAAEHGHQPRIDREGTTEALERVLVDLDVRVDERDHLGARIRGAAVARLRGPGAGRLIDHHELVGRGARRPKRREAACQRRGRIGGRDHRGEGRKLAFGRRRACRFRVRHT